MTEERELLHFALIGISKSISDGLRMLEEQPDSKLVRAYVDKLLVKQDEIRKRHFEVLKKRRCYLKHLF